MRPHLPCFGALEVEHLAYDAAAQADLADRVKTGVRGQDAALRGLPGIGVRRV